MSTLARDRSASAAGHPTSAGRRVSSPKGPHQRRIGVVKQPWRAAGATYTQSQGSADVFVARNGLQCSKLLLGGASIPCSFRPSARCGWKARPHLGAGFCGGPSIRQFVPLLLKRCKCLRVHSRVAPSSHAMQQPNSTFRVSCIVLERCVSVG